MHDALRLLARAVPAAALVLLILLPAPNVTAAEKNRGLLITPLREYVTVEGGQTASKSITVANLTEKSITVALSVEQFSVADYSYDYEFKPTKNDWIKLSMTEVELKPNKSQKIPYQINVPAKAAPGGQYFTVFATISLEGNGIRSQVQAATIVYVTVQGDLSKTSVVRKTNIPWVSFGKDLLFELDVKNTGNTHFFVYASGKLQGLGSKKASSETTSLLLPDTIRKVGNIIPAPFLPGVYKATYGYRTDADQTIQYSRYVLYLPLWSIAIPLGIVWLIVLLRRHRTRTRK